jgi:hypothetical protein
VATLQTDLVNERKKLDDMREQLQQAKKAAGRPSSAAQTPGAASGGAAATPATGAGAGGRQRKRQRTAAEAEDEAMAGVRVQHLITEMDYVCLQSFIILLSLAGG